MKAVIFPKFGGPEVVSVAELPMPVARPGEAIIRVAASTVNPTDLMMRSGKQAQLMSDLSPPFIAGMEFSGHVHSVSEGVELPVGQAVFGVVNPRRPDGGAHAQYIRVPSASVVAISRTADLVEAATVPMNALTALLAVELARVKFGDSVLVTGGTGMLGGSVLQLARHIGLHTIASGAEADEDLLHSLGAAVVVPRDAPALSRFVHEIFPEGVDALIDGALIGSELAHLVRTGGTAVSLRMSHPIRDPRLSTPYVSVLAGMERNDLISQVGSLFDQGVLSGRVAQGGRIDFRQASIAHSLAERTGLRGRVVLTFGGE